MNSIIHTTSNSMRWSIAMGFWVLTLCTFIIYLNYVEPLKVLLDGENYLDLRFEGYGYAEVVTFYETLGEAGRALYVKTTIFDTVWPMMIGLSAVLLAPLCFQKRWLVILAMAFPVAFATFDLMENIGLLNMTTRYPEITPEMASYTVTLTLTKGAMIPGATVAFLGLPLIALYRKLKGRPSSEVNSL